MKKKGKKKQATNILCEVKMIACSMYSFIHLLIHISSWKKIKDILIN